MKKILIFCFIVTNLVAMSNIEVAKKNDVVTSGFESSTSKMIMTLINARGQESIRELSGKTLEVDSGDKSLMVFLSPADVKGTKMLTHERLNKDDNQWLYLPALKRVKRIASRNKSGSFMGSEFSYEDIAQPSYKEYTYKNDLEKVSLNGKDFYKGTRVPNDKNSGYTKQVTWTDTQDFLVQKVDYYDRKKELLKTATFSDYKKLNGIWRIGKIVIVNHQNSKKTILEWRDEKIKVGLKDKDFSKRKLKK